MFAKIEPSSMAASLRSAKVEQDLPNLLADFEGKTAKRAARGFPLNLQSAGVFKPIGTFESPANGVP